MLCYISSQLKTFNINWPVKLARHALACLSCICWCWAAGIFLATGHHLPLVHWIHVSKWHISWSSAKKPSSFPSRWVSIVKHREVLSFNVNLFLYFSPTWHHINLQPLKRLRIEGWPSPGQGQCPYYPFRCAYFVLQWIVRMLIMLNWMMPLFLYPWIWE